MCMCEAFVFALGIVDKEWNLQLQQLVVKCYWQKVCIIKFWE